jgi:hypothetical protein
MTVQTETDLTLPLIPEIARRNQGAVPPAAYVPIAIAMIGVALVLIGGISVRAVDTSSVAVAAAETTLPNVAKDRDVAHDLEFLDR